VPLALTKNEEGKLNEEEGYSAVKESIERIKKGIITIQKQQQWDRNRLSLHSETNHASHIKVLTHSPNLLLTHSPNLPLTQGSHWFHCRDSFLYYCIYLSNLLRAAVVHEQANEWHKRDQALGVTPSFIHIYCNKNTTLKHYLK
jgi:hypothetical protein